MELTKYSQLRDKMPVTCSIYGVEITDAKLALDKEDHVWICNNELGTWSSDGVEAKLSKYGIDLQGYKYAHFFAEEDQNADEDGKWRMGVQNLKSLD